MKQLTIAFVLLFFFGLMVQAAGAEDVEVSGSLKATSFAGDGSGLTGISPVSLSFYGKVAIVATSGGDYTNPAEAMSDSAVATWCGTPSETNRCLLKIMPGVYDVGSCDTAGTPPFSCVLYMKEYVDIEGSGENTTVITGAMDGGAPSPTPVAGTVMGANNAEIRFLTVENTAPGYSRAIFTLNTSPSILHVTARAHGGTTNTAITNNSSSPKMTNVTAEASGGTNTRGMVISSSSPIIMNATVEGSGGTTNNYGFYIVDSSSATMTNVNVNASGGTNNYGIIFSSTTDPAAAAMTNVTVTASGGTKSSGIRVTNNFSLTMTNVTATASNGSSTNYGIESVLPSPSGTIKINHSVLSGTTKAIYNLTGVTVLLSYSQLEGGLSNSGSITCVGAYDVSYVALGTDCLPLP